MEGWIHIVIWSVAGKTVRPFAANVTDFKGCGVGKLALYGIVSKRLPLVEPAWEDECVYL
jgi:hypothetical protein